MCEARTRIKFGTDGWRAVISDEFTFENVKRVAQGIAEYYNLHLALPSSNTLTLGRAGSAPKMAVGYDSRFMSEHFAKITADTLAQNGIEVYISDRCIPTPTLSLAVKNKKLSAGVMITASHNPHEYNGIKIKTADGAAAGKDVTDEVEKLIEIGPNLKNCTPAKINKCDFTKDYIKFLKNYIDLKKIKPANFKVLVDPMHGSGNGYIADVLKGTKIKLEFTRQERNPYFDGLRPEPILENLLETQKILRKNKFDLCLVLDGDADRIAAFTGEGEFISPQKILGLLMLHLNQDRKISGAAVKTVCGTNMLDNIAKDLGIKLYETPVGFKYISELMIKENVMVGGEEAGGMGFKNYIPERDGSLAGLLLLEMMVYRKKSIAKILKDMETKYGRYYYVKDSFGLKNLNVDLSVYKNIKTLLNKEVVKVEDIDGVKLIASDASWLMFRGSGTEPIMRVYAESKSASKSKRLLELGKKLILDNDV